MVMSDETTGVTARHNADCGFAASYAANTELI